MVFKAQEVFVTSGKKKGSVRREIHVVSSMRVTIIQSRHRKPHDLQKHEAEVRLAEIFDRRVNTSLKGTCTESPCEYWHPPECQFYKTKSGCKFGAECSFPHWKVEEQANKAEKVMTKMQLLL